MNNLVNRFKNSFKNNLKNNLTNGLNMMNVIICTLLIAIVLYVIYYHHNIKNIEKFLNQNNKEMDNSINFIKELEIIKQSLPKTKQITSNQIIDESPFAEMVGQKINKLNEAEADAFNQQNKQQTETVQKLRTKLNNFRDQLEIEWGRDPQMILSVTSHQNGQPVSVLPVSNNKHIVMVNNKCLSCNSVGKYELQDCDNQNINQHFKLSPVYNDTDYNAQLDATVPKVKGTDNHGKKIKYPFMIIKSVTSGNCLANENGNIYMGHCKGNESQRWNGSTSIYKCK